MTAGNLYVSWRPTPDTPTPHSRLVRLEGVFGQPIDAAGSLWVTTSLTTGETLLRLNPLDFKLTGRWRIGGNSSYAEPYSLAFAGGHLWISGRSQLLRVSIPAGKVTLSVMLPGASTSDVAANAAGTVLFDSEANGKGGAEVQQRDPGTGALLASYPMVGLAAPAIAGAIGSGLWMSGASGMMGYVERVDATTLEPSPADRRLCREGKSTRTCISGTDGIHVILANGLVWITQLGGGSDRNYCAKPGDGQVLAPLTLPKASRDSVLAIDTHYVYYVRYARGGSLLDRQDLPPGCRTR